ncbi:MAG: hypothetical protein ACYC1I_13085 [Acidimicrobiales bacterium]
MSDGHDDEIAAPVDWRATPPAERAILWTEFVEWVEWYLGNYEITTSVIPECWPEHPTLVEELSALWTAHLASYDIASTATLPLRWLEDAARQRDRLKTYIERLHCTPAKGHVALEVRRAPVEATMPNFDD